MQVNSEFLLGNSTYLNHKNKLLEYQTVVVPLLTALERKTQALR